MAATTSKRQIPHPQYELLYHPAIPGRGEFVRLAFEAAGVPYTDVANEDKKGGYGTVRSICNNQSDGDEDGNPPVFSPPALRVPGVGKNGKALVIHQTPNILLYLGPKLELIPEDEAESLYVNQITLTALDLNDEVHDTHHPVASMKYYEALMFTQEQKGPALAKAEDFRTNRLPKFFSHFERTLKSNKVGGGKYMVSDKLTYADTSIWQVLDGLKFAFPKEMEAREKEFPALLNTFYAGIKEEKGLKEYLKSERRLPYSMGIFRYYPELDRQ